MATENLKSFIDYVQYHERIWGTDEYPENKRPSLADILGAEVVIFWSPEDKKEDKRQQISIHNDLTDVEKYLAKLLFRSSVNPPTQRIARIFHQQKLVRVKSVKFDFEIVE